MIERSHNSGSCYIMLCVYIDVSRSLRLTHGIKKHLAVLLVFFEPLMTTSISLHFSPLEHLVFFLLCTHGQMFLNQIGAVSLSDIPSTCCLVRPTWLWTGMDPALPLAFRTDLRAANSSGRTRQMGHFHGQWGKGSTCLSLTVQEQSVSLSINFSEFYWGFLPWT